MHHDPDFHAPPRRILVLVDRDPEIGRALEQAAALAASLEAELVLLGVGAPQLDRAPTATVVAANKAMDRLTRERVVRARDLAPARVCARAIFGAAPTGRAVVEAARAERAELVVLPLRRGHELSHLLHDGTERHVLHHSSVPVLIVPEA